MEGEGYNIEIKRADIYDVYSARIVLKLVMNKFGISDSRSGDIMIKFEVNMPNWEIKTESAVISSFGLLFNIVIMDKGLLLAEKSHAFIKRCRGRDVYDIIFLLKNKFSIDPEMFKAKKIEGKPKEALLKKFNSLKNANMNSLINQVRPFLFEEEIEYVKKAYLFGPELLKKY